MRTSYDIIRQVVLLFALIALAGLAYSFWVASTGSGTWFRVAVWFLVLVCTAFAYVIVFAKGLVVRRRETLARMACPSCGTVYGLETALQARHDYMERVKDAYRHHQSPKDLGPYWQVRCPKCSKQARYQKDTCKLETHVA